MEAMVNNFSAKFLAAKDLFVESEGNDLEKQRSEEYHTFIAKGLFECKRARPDIHPAIAVLCTHVNERNKDNWKRTTIYQWHKKRQVDFSR
jgi:hypothetical protein